MCARRSCIVSAILSRVSTVLVVRCEGISIRARVSSSWWMAMYICSNFKLSSNDVGGVSSIYGKRWSDF